jgi:hypothetical protein
MIAIAISLRWKVTKDQGKKNLPPTGQNSLARFSARPLPSFYIVLFYDKRFLQEPIVSAPAFGRK